VETSFDFSFVVDQWSKDYVHQFKNFDHYDGICLIPKKYKLSAEEIELRVFKEKKYIDVNASVPKKYDSFIIETYNDYLTALENSNTELFWASSNNIDTSNFNFSTYFTHDNKYDRTQNHAFVHRVNEQDFYNGVFLLTKSKMLSRKEIEHRHLVNRKEWPIVASGPVQYDCFVIDTYDDYLYALENSKTEMFWGTSNNLIVDTNFKFDLYLSHDDYDRKQNHAFIHQVNGKDYYNGIFLFSKHKLVSEKEIAYRHLVERKEWSIVASGPVQYDCFVIDTYDDYLYALENSKTEMFWGTSNNIKIDPNFKFDLYLSHDDYDRKTNHAFIHEVFDKKTYDGVFLFSKHTPVTKKEIEFRHLINRKEWTDVASTYLPYEVFQIDSFEEYITAVETTKTEMFWMTSRNISLNPEFNFNIYYDYRDNEFVTERKTTHAFVHRINKQDYYNGVFLLSKHTLLSNKEIEHRFPINRKEVPIVASGPVQYDCFVIDTYNDYLYALENSKTEMFWGTSNNTKINEGFNFDIYFTHDNEYDRKQNHAFVHRVNGKDYYNGVFLFSKHKPVSEKEIAYRHLVDRKEWSMVASGPVQYDRFVIDNYDDYLYALENSKTEMFWGTSNNIKIDPNFKFDLYLSHDEYDRTQNHAFVHRVNDEDYYNGVFLCSKHKPVSEKEIKYRHLIDRKEWPIVASVPVQYEKFTIDTYDDYLNALTESKTEMFWMIPDYVYVDPDFSFGTYFTHNNEYDRSVNHSFLNGKYHDGIILCSKYAKFSKREFDYKFIANKKETNTIISTPKPYDIVFISYQEPNCDENYAKLLEQYPNANRVHGVKGIHQAHIEAAKLCKTDMFWIIDGDAELVNTFDLDYQVARWDIDTVHVWRSKNPINNLVYGYGGVKLFPRLLTINMDITKPDMTTSISSKFKAVHEISNITAFNTDPFNTWKSAFRECTKLASKIIDRQKDEETVERLEVWKTVGTDTPYGSYAIAGAIAGAEYGEKNKNNIESLKKINDFEWLKEQFDATQK
jgi:hypothetical protein